MATKNNPPKEVRMGSIKATIWKNDTEADAFFQRHHGVPRRFQSWLISIHTDPMSAPFRNPRKFAGLKTTVLPCSLGAFSSGLSASVSSFFRFSSRRLCLR